MHHFIAELQYRVYIGVVLGEPWTEHDWHVAQNTPCYSQWVAKECRSVCTVAQALASAAFS